MMDTGNTRPNPNPPQPDPCGQTIADGWAAAIAQVREGITQLSAFVDAMEAGGPPSNDGGNG